MYLSTQLRTLEQNLTGQPLPRNWRADHPAFDGVDNIGTLIGALRDFARQDRCRAGGHNHQLKPGTGRLDTLPSHHSAPIGNRNP